MTDPNAVHPNYRGMLEIQNQAQAGDAVSATQAQLMDMDPGARWSHELSHQAYAVGGIEDASTGDAKEPDGQPDPLG